MSVSNKRQKTAEPIESIFVAVLTCPQGRFKTGWSKKIVSEKKSTFTIFNFKFKGLLVWFQVTSMQWLPCPIQALTDQVWLENQYVYFFKNKLFHLRLSTEKKALMNYQNYTILKLEKQHLQQ